jgi:hypothetical protein
MVKVDTSLLSNSLAAAGQAAAQAEVAGFDGVWSAELEHDPFLPLVPAALSTSRVDIGTAIAVAFSVPQWSSPILRGMAFYASTPAYRGVLEVHGWGELQTDLHRLSKEGEWTKMGTFIDAEILDAFAVVALIDQLGSALAKRIGGLADRTSLHLPKETDADTVVSIIDALRSA